MMDTILFDLDGTLLPFLQEDFIKAYFKALVRRLTPMGYDGEKLVSAIWQGTGAMIANDGAATNRQVFWEVFIQKMGISAMGLESILEDFYIHDFDRVRSVLQAQADRSELIRSLRAKGYRLILATNPIFPEQAVETRLHWVGLCSADFDYVTTYENSRHSKPNPAYYTDILHNCGLKSGQCVMVGNNPGDDMAALQAGIDAWLVTDYLENPDEKTIESYRHSSFADLEAWLMQLPAVK